MMGRQFAWISKSLGYLKLGREKLGAEGQVGGVSGGGDRDDPVEPAGRVIAVFSQESSCAANCEIRRPVNDLMAKLATAHRLTAPQ